MASLQSSWPFSTLVASICPREAANFAVRQHQLGAAAICPELPTGPRSTIAIPHKTKTTFAPLIHDQFHKLTHTYVPFSKLLEASVSGKDRRTPTSHPEIRSQSQQFPQLTHHTPAPLPFDGFPRNPPPSPPGHLCLHTKPFATPIPTTASEAPYHVHPHCYAGSTRSPSPHLGASASPSISSHHSARPESTSARSPTTGPMPASPCACAGGTRTCTAPHSAGRCSA